MLPKNLSRQAATDASTGVAIFPYLWPSVARPQQRKSYLKRCTAVVDMWNVDTNSMLCHENKADSKPLYTGMICPAAAAAATSSALRGVASPPCVEQLHPIIGMQVPNCRQRSTLDLNAVAAVAASSAAATKSRRHRNVCMSCCTYDTSTAVWRAVHDTSKKYRSISSNY